MKEEAKIIAIGLQKGGVGKSTSTGILSYLLAKDYKVLAVDLDSQGNLTRFLTQRSIYDFDNRTVLEALKEEDGLKYAYPITENLHVLPSNDYMASFPRFLYTEYRQNINYCLRETLKEAKQVYDYILLDTPPSLSEHTTNALCCADYLVICFETHQFSYEAIERFLETYRYAKEKFNPGIEILGILANKIDNRRKETDKFIAAVDRDYPNLRFKNIVNHQASTSRLASLGFQNNKELAKAVEPYEKVKQEMIERANRK